MKKVKAILVTYNKPKLLEKCLMSIVHQTYLPDSVLVIDNGGLQDTADAIQNVLLQSKVPITHHIMTENVGGAGGFSAGIELAVKEENEFLWIMDDDTLPHATTLEEMMKADDYCESLGITAGYFASNVRWTDGSPAVMNMPSVVPVWNNFTDAHLLEIRSCSFVSVLIRTSEIRKVGLPIQEFFIWRDDVEFTRRIAQKSRAFFVADSLVTHMMAENKGVNILKETNPDRVDRYFYDVRNGVYFENKYNGLKGKIKFSIKEILLIPKAMKTSAGRKKRHILLKGLWAGWHFHPSIRQVSENANHS